MIQAPSSIPEQTLGQIFGRFLRFGCLAWGGPVAQIAMIERELVEEEKWISPERFNRAYAVYQVLPGPEAHELCVYFGTLARGRIGGLLAGLGFMLPGFGLMLALSWFYVTYGIESPAFGAMFAGIQAAVLALIVRALHRIGSHALTGRYLWGIGIAAAAATLAGVHFAITLLLAGVVHEALTRRSRWLSWGTALAVTGAVVWAICAPHAASGPLLPDGEHVVRAQPDLLALFGFGLRSGLLTFGGAYTAIPMLLHDAVDTGAWMTREQFLDGVALGGILPAPLIIFGTFVGYIGRGPLGALALTAGIFLPAFGFTMAGHELLERVILDPRLQRFLAGVTAGVVGLIAATTISLAPTCLSSGHAIAVFAVGLLILYAWRAKFAVAVVVALAGVSGWLFFPR